MCSQIQILLYLAWVIIVYKNQGLMLEKAIVNIGKKEFIIGLIFVVLSRVHSINGLCLKQFNFDRLQHIKNCKKLQKRKLEEEYLHLMIIT